jgi:hypothetical protein
MLSGLEITIHHILLHISVLGMIHFPVPHLRPAVQGQEYGLAPDLEVLRFRPVLVSLLLDTVKYGKVQFEKASCEVRVISGENEHDRLESVKCGKMRYDKESMRRFERSGEERR